jgi:hypothetical protein
MITVIEHMNVETAPKRLELLHELLPSEKVVGLLVNRTNPVAQSVSAEVKSTALALGIEIQVVEVRNDEELDRAFARSARDEYWRACSRHGSVLYKPHGEDGRIVAACKNADDLSVSGFCRGRRLVVVAGVEVYQVAAEPGLGRFAEPGECFQSRAVMDPVELDRVRNREWKFELR